MLYCDRRFCDEQTLQTIMQESYKLVPSIHRPGFYADYIYVIVSCARLSWFTSQSSNIHLVKLAAKKKYLSKRYQKTALASGLLMLGDAVKGERTSTHLARNKTSGFGICCDGAALVRVSKLWQVKYHNSAVTLQDLQMQCAAMNMPRDNKYYVLFSICASQRWFEPHDSQKTSKAPYSAVAKSMFGLLNFADKECHCNTWFQILEKRLFEIDKI